MSIIPKDYRKKSRIAIIAVIAIVFVVPIAVFGVYLNYLYSDEDAIADESLPHLNLTKNAIWDYPVMNDTCFEDLERLILASSDSVYLNKYLYLNTTAVDYSEVEKIVSEIDNMPDSPYKGELQMLCLNDLFMSVPGKKMTTELIHSFIERGFKIASGKNKVSQSVFFSFWDNCILSYSNLNKIDSVCKEAERFMKVCRQQGFPLGTMHAYMGLAYCLMDDEDYLGASEYLEKATEIAEQNFPTAIGKDWRNANPNYSNFLGNYYQALTLDARCRLEAGDSVWLKKHEKWIEYNLNQIKDFAISGDLFYCLANYNDRWGSEKKYNKIVEQFRDSLEKRGCFDTIYNNAPSTVNLHMYYIILVRHELRLNHGDKAMAIMKEAPDFFDGSRSTYYPEALRLQGNYKESAEKYQIVCDNLYHLINESDRNMMKTLFFNIEEEDKQMQLLEAKISSQRTHLLYNSLLLFIFNVLIVGLGYFLYRQHRMNQKLVDAVEKAEKANNAKNVFLKNMTEELHTPLDAIQRDSKILAERTTNPKDEKFVNDMAGTLLEKSEKLTSLLNNIVEETDKLTSS